MPTYDTISAQEPDYPLALKLAELLRRARGGLDKVGEMYPATAPLDKKLREYLPSLGELVVGKTPEGLDRVAYGRPLIGGGPTLQTFKVPEETSDLFGAGAGMAGLAAKGAPAAARGAARAAENAAVPRAAGALQRGGIDLGEQKVLPGLELTPTERFKQGRADWQRLYDLPDDTPNLAQKRAEVTVRMDQAREDQIAERLAQDKARIAELRAGRSPQEGLGPSFQREEKLLTLKESLPHTSATVDLRRASRGLVRQLREAKQEMNAPPPEVLQPGWVHDLTMPPSQRYGGQSPAGADWWNQQFGIDPDQPPASVAAFLRSIRDEPSAFQYGTMPEGARDLEDFADVFGKRAGKRIRVTEDINEDYDEPYKIETEKTHGRGEYMRDPHGDYKYSDEPKEHGWGDYPMYDPEGNVKRKELMGPTQDLEPLLVKRRAKGGEVKRDEYGNEKYPLAKSEGGETMRDERGNIKYTEEENPDYNPSEAQETKLYVSGPEGGNITVHYGDGDYPTMGAMGGGKAGALLYQTKLAHASKIGEKIGVNSLTGDNAFRMLSNTLSNYARTGINPRSVSGTASGSRPRATGFAPGDRIWQAETGESEARLAGGLGGRADPGAVTFDGSTFHIKGEPVSADAIAKRLREVSPRVEESKVGPKSVMRGAVYRWLEQATPEQAEAAAKSWGNVGSPLFGVLGMAGAGALAAKLRAGQQEETQ